MAADSYVCTLEETFDHRSLKLRWSLPRKEICHCQAVVAPRKTGSQSCSRDDNSDMDEDLWFTDDPTPLVNRNNWNKEKLNEYLDRSFCCTYDFLLF